MPSTASCGEHASRRTAGSEPGLHDVAQSGARVSGVDCVTFRHVTVCGGAPLEPAIASVQPLSSGWRQDHGA